MRANVLLVLLVAVLAVFCATTMVSAQVTVTETLYITVGAKKTSTPTPTHHATPTTKPTAAPNTYPAYASGAFFLVLFIVGVIYIVFESIRAGHNAAIKLQHSVHSDVQNWALSSHKIQRKYLLESEELEKVATEGNIVLDPK